MGVKTSPWARYKIEIEPGPTGTYEFKVEAGSTYEVSADYVYRNEPGSSIYYIKSETPLEDLQKVTHSMPYQVSYELNSNSVSVAKSDTPKSVDSDVRAEMKKRERERLLKEKMDLIDSFGADTFENGTVVKFSKKYEKNGTTFDYAAIKANDMWYTTAVVGTKPFTWEEFLSWLVSGEFPASEFTLMVPMPAKVD